MELRRSGFSDEEIRAHENELRQNSRVNTARALKEHFILERIAEEQEHRRSAEQDYDAEIMLIARQSGESPRRVRAQLEKGGLMDTLRNQIIERKVIDLILESAKFKDVPYEIEGADAEAIDQSAGRRGRATFPKRSTRARRGRPGAGTKQDTAVAEVCRSGSAPYWPARRPIRS